MGFKYRFKRSCGVTSVVKWRMEIWRQRSSKDQNVQCNNQLTFQMSALEQRTNPKISGASSTHCITLPGWLLESGGGGRSWRNWNKLCWFLQWWFDSYSLIWYQIIVVPFNFLSSDNGISSMRTACLILNFDISFTWWMVSYLILK